MSLNQAIAALRNNQFQNAILMCDKVLGQFPAHADAFHIKALAAKQLGELESAKQYFLQSLRSNPKQPAVLSNYANLLVQLGQFAQASEQFKQALDLDNKNIDAWINWAMMLTHTQEFEQAINKLQQALKFHAKHPRLLSALAYVYQQYEAYPAALELYDQALLLVPNDIQCLHNKGVIYRLIGKPQASIQSYEKIEALKRPYPELYFNLGCAFYDSQNLPLAIQNLQKAIALKPDYVDAHEALNKVFWEQNQQDQFLSSYQQAFQQLPNSAALLFSYAAMLIMSEQPDKAQAVLTSSIDKIGREPQFLHALAVIKNQQSENSQDVLKLLLEAHHAQPQNVKYLIDIANYFIKQAAYPKALSYLDQAADIAPLNQEIWAYKGLCWRLLDDPRASWLNNYEDFIDAEFLETPEGYQDLAHFMSVLRAELSAMHKGELQPLDQSVKGGTQTVGRLLSEPAKVIQDFKQVLEKRISKYLANLPVDPNHPFLNSNTQSFKFSGSWSVRLQGGGFHVNHVHPQGWLSCCTYIEVPQNMQPHDPNKSGWVKFGETSLALNEKEQIGKQICPEEGLCVLFPSYFWHGTNSFESDHSRMTIPCDIMPT
ncbi:tetratricopeptide repeat protein [Paraglaciecola aestuariivivens]